MNGAAAVPSPAPSSAPARQWLREPPAGPIATPRPKADHTGSLVATSLIVVLGLSACQEPPRHPRPLDPILPATRPAPASDQPPSVVEDPLGVPAGDPALGTTFEHLITSNDGTYVVAFNIDPSPIPLNELFSLDIRILDADRPEEIVGSAQLAVDARMPDHAHGMTTAPHVTRGHEGAYKADGLMFHMPGYWELTFDITRGGITERAQMNITLE